MAQFTSCNSTLLNSTSFVNNSILSHVANLTCQNSSAASNNSSGTSDSSNSTLLVGGVAKYFCYVFYALVLLLGVFGNIVVFYVVGFRKKKRNSGDVYILSLACADLFGSLAAPLIMLNDLITDMSVWFYGEILCYIMPAIIPATMCASAWSLVLISVDRLRVISKPMLPDLPRKYTYASIALIWLPSVIIAIPYSLRLQFVEGACLSFNERILGFKGFVIFIGIALLYILCVPYLILILTYVRTARALKASSLKHDNNRAMELRNRQNAKVVKMFVIVVTIFLILTMPYAIFYFCDSYLIFYAPNHFDSRTHHTLNYVLFILASANGCVNPVIYAKMHREVNGYIKKVIHRIMTISCQRLRLTNRDTSAPSSTWSVATLKTDQCTV